ncbi:peptide chain release factor 1 [Patescibacteria group bacterium]|nr:peptide chain release factor 1 [Patescibacteria group bacterium]
MADIKTIKKEYQDLLQKISNPDLISNWKKFKEFSERKDFLEKIISKERELKEIKNRIEENKLIISSKEDQELVVLAETELIQLKEKGGNLEREIRNLLQEKGAKRNQAVIIEIRAGTGGEEAALFASDIFRMYSKYAQLRGWKQRILDSRPTELDGYKEIIFELKNGNVFSKMKYEGGVHRVQRVPVTEKVGRIHTSTATVAVLPKPRKAEIKIRPEDLRLDLYRASGPGGQYVNRRETAVRITHLPTGLVVTSQTERSQLQNKENAISILEARLLKRKETVETKKIREKRKTQIGWAKRAEKIRTYNFPQNRITDHRIKKSWYNLEKILNGELDPIIEALRKAI